MMEIVPPAGFPHPRRERNILRGVGSIITVRVLFQQDREVNKPRRRAKLKVCVCSCGREIEREGRRGDKFLGLTIRDYVLLAFTFSLVSTTERRDGVAVTRKLGSHIPSMFIPTRSPDPKFDSKILKVKKIALKLINHIWVKRFCLYFYFIFFQRFRWSWMNYGFFFFLFLFKTL